MTLEFFGTVVDFVHRSIKDDDSWAIFKVRADNLTEELKQLTHVFKVSGEIPIGLTEYDRIKCSGTIVRHEKFGLSFKAAEISQLMPKTKDEVRDCIAHMIGVGRVRADLVVNAYKDEPDIIQAIIQNRKRLDAVIKDIILANLIVRNIETKWNLITAETFLWSLGLRRVNIKIICKALYGRNIKAEITANPFSVFEEIGFEKCDNIANTLGFAADSHLRLDAGALWMAMNICNSNGHCAVIYDHLVADSADKLEVPADNIIAAIVRLQEEKKLIDADLLGQHVLFPKSLWDAEQGVIDHISRILSIRAPEITIEHSLNFHPSEDQQIAISSIIRSKISILTGRPGTGKTTVIRCILDSALAAELKVSLVAPTSLAALRMKKACGYNATTIHRALGRVSKDDADEGKINELPSLAESDVIVVDEMSMVGIKLFFSLISKIKDSAMILLVGDPDQLQSIEPGNVLGDLIDSCVIPVCRLVKIHRQSSDSQICENAERINSGEMPIVTDSRSFQMMFYESNATIIETTSKLAEYLVIGRKVDPLAGIQIICPTNALVDELNIKLQSRLNPNVYRRAMRYFAGDKVIQIDNNYELNVINGEIGRVLDVDESNELVVVQYDGHTVTYAYEKLKQVNLAYAITIHKSQGSEFSFVIIVIPKGCGSHITRRLIYTAVTRSRKAVIIIGDREAIEQAIANNRSDIRYTGLGIGLNQKLS